MQNIQKNTFILMKKVKKFKMIKLFIFFKYILFMKKYKLIIKCIFYEIQFNLLLINFFIIKINFYLIINFL